MKLKVLDLFCGAGGAAMGYYRAFTAAGFDVDITGVDVIPQPRYPFAFRQSDAMDWKLSSYDFIHASCPCQQFSTLRATHRHDATYATRHPDLIAPIRVRLMSSGKPYIMENVPNAPLLNPVMLCGATLGLKVYRHRVFESNYLLLAPAHYPHHDKTPAVGRGISPKGFISITGNGGFAIPDGLNYAKRAIGIDWMQRKELSQAIPPAYTQYLGSQIAQVFLPQRKAVTA